MSSEPITNLVSTCCGVKLCKGEKCRCEEIKTSNDSIKTISEWIESFNGNNNTGVNEEKKTGIEILLRSGLDNKDNLPSEYKDIISRPTITGILGVINLTQSDNIGGTGDIGIVYSDGTTKYFSVTQWNGKLSKGICNPSAKKWYGLPNSPEIQKINEEAYNLGKKYREENYGDNPNKKWKRCKDCPGAKMMAEYLAKEASKSWNTMDKKSKIKSLNHFLDIDTKLQPHTTGIIYWNKKKGRIECIYKWDLNIEIGDYLDTYSDGIYIYHGTPDNYILKTQAKYNNGIIEGMPSKVTPDKWVIKKSTSYLSSWGVVAEDLTKIFKMTTISLDK